MKIIPVMTEKSLDLARDKGKYTFWVLTDLTKPKIKELINATFGVHVREIQTQSYKARTRTNISKKNIGVKARKRAVVSLRDKEKIDLFQSDKKKK